MIKFTKKADVGFIDLAFMFLFAIFIVIMFIVFGLYENPLVRDAQPQHDYRDMEAARILQGILRSHVTYSDQFMTLAEFIRVTELKESNDKELLKQRYQYHLAAFSSKTAGDKAYEGALMSVHDASGNELFEETYGDEEYWLPLLTSAGGTSFFTVTRVGYTGRAEQVIPGFNGPLTVRFAIMGRAYKKIT